MAAVDLEKRFELDIKYHRQALNVCSDDFPYKADIHSSLTERFAEHAHQLYQQGAYAKALKYYDEARKSDPNHFESINQIGCCLIHQGLYKDAREYFHELIDRVRYEQAQRPLFYFNKYNTYQSNAWMNISYTYRMQRLWTKAEDALQEARKLVLDDSPIVAAEQKICEMKEAEAFNQFKQKVFAEKALYQDDARTHELDYLTTHS